MEGRPLNSGCFSESRRKKTPRAVVLNLGCASQGLLKHRLQGLTPRVSDLVVLGEV